MLQVADWFAITLPENYTECDVELSQQYANREAVLFSLIAALSVSTIFSVSCACYSRYGCSPCCRKTPATERSRNNADSVEPMPQSSKSADGQNPASTSGNTVADDAGKDCHLSLSEPDPDPSTASAMTSTAETNGCKCVIVKGLLETAFANYHHKKDCDPKRAVVQIKTASYRCSEHIDDFLLNDGVRIISPKKSSGKSPMKSTKISPAKSTSGQSDSTPSNSRLDEALDDDH